MISNACWAHAGDGNLHFSILKMDMSDEEWEKTITCIP